MRFKVEPSIVMTHLSIGITAKEDVASFGHFGNNLTYPFTDFLTSKFGFGLIWIWWKVPNYEKGIDVRSDAANSPTSTSNGVIRFIYSVNFSEARGAKGNHTATTFVR
jgi:hypothetical protein